MKVRGAVYKLEPGHTAVAVADHYLVDLELRVYIPRSAPAANVLPGVRTIRTGAGHAVTTSMILAPGTATLLGAFSAPLFEPGAADSETMFLWRVELERSPW